MKVIWHKVESEQDDTIVITYSNWTAGLEEIEKYILNEGKQITVYGNDKEMLHLQINEILYFEAVGELVFAYTKNHVYELKMRLYQIEESLKADKIMRASKSILLNMHQIKSVRPAMNGRLYAKMVNDEEVLVSRQYAKEIKKAM